MSEDEILEAAKVLHTDRHGGDWGYRSIDDSRLDEQWRNEEHECIADVRRWLEVQDAVANVMARKLVKL